MLTYIGWALAAILTFLLIVLVCPVRYRCEAGNQGGFLDIILLFGLYTKHIDLNGAPEDEEEPRETEPVKPGTAGQNQEKEMKAPASSQPAGMEPAGTAAEAEEGPDEHTEGKGAAETVPERAAEPCGEAKSGGQAETVEENETAPAHPSNAKVLIYAWRNGTIHLALALLRSIYHHAKPKEFLITGTAGLGDPMETGIAAGLAYAAIPGAIRIDWNYTESVCRITVKAKGRIVPAYLLWVGGRFILEKPVRETLRYRRNEE